ncbi:GNAT family N-acetyltransferase [Campylobacter coli]|nr:GNAT family N-acetyltransferase [Campylobacter coli]EFN2768909.1 GNAT family N-acetyltransferase [Campylobacter coli]EFN2983057.1 GNAT family N-acetyltransferase [Campylobacter coli]EHU8403618.1 GNAT family N-acetyltransferase [Campylobacter coli]EJD4611035.1 GNAT family N-acetyltransferase [Campylobacter coli]
MKLLEEFEQNYVKGFLFHNCYENIQDLKDKICKNEIEIQYNNGNFFFYSGDILYYFINNPSELNIRDDCYIYLINYSDAYFSKHEKFLFQCDIRLLNIFRQMELKNQDIENIQFDFVRKACVDDMEEAYVFFKRYFPITFDKLTTYANFKRRYNELLIYKESGCIRGALLYGSFKSYAIIDHFAVDRNLEYNNVAYALINFFFRENRDKAYFRLFVDMKNEHAIKFYKRLNFNFNKIQYRLYEKNDKRRKNERN